MTKNFDIFHFRYISSLLLVLSMAISGVTARDNKDPKKGPDLSTSLDSIRSIYANDPEKGITLASQLFKRVKKSGQEKRMVPTALLYGSCCLKSGQSKRAHDIFQFLKDSLKIQIPDSLTGEFLKNYGGSEYYMGEFHTAKSIYEEWLKFAQIKNDTLMTANALTSLGAVSIRTGNLDKSLEYSQSALESYKTINDKKGQAFVLNNIGGIYSYLALHDTAEYYFTRSLELNEELRDSFTMVTILINLASISRAKGNTRESLREDRRALSIGRKIQNKSLVPKLLLAVAKDYIALEEFEEAETLLEEGFQKCVESGNNYDEMHFRNTLGELYYKKKLPEKSLSILLPGIELAERKENNEMLAELNLIVSQVYASMGNYKNAYESYRSYHDHYDSLFNEKSRARLNELEVQYQNKEKIAQIAALKNEHTLYELEKKRDHLERSLLWAVIVFIAGLSLLLFFYFLHNRKTSLLLRQKNNQLAEAVAIKNKLFSIVAHDLKNPLNSIIGFSSLIASGREDIESVTHYAGYIKNSGIQSFEMIDRLLEWSSLNLNEIPFTIHRNDLGKTVSRAVSDISNFAAIKSIQIKNEINAGTWCFYDDNSIYSVLVNFLSNAVKFSYKNSEVTIQSQQKEDFIFVSIQDQGIGVNETLKEELLKDGIAHSRNGTLEEKGTGLGFSISREFIARNGGKIWIESGGENRGTRVSFSLRVNQE